MVDIQSATTEIRRGKNKERKKKIEETTGQKYNSPLLRRAAIKILVKSKLLQAGVVSS